MAFQDLQDATGSAFHSCQGHLHGAFKFLWNLVSTAGKSPGKFSVDTEGPVHCI